MQGFFFFSLLAFISSCFSTSSFRNVRFLLCYVTPGKRRRGRRGDASRFALALNHFLLALRCAAQSAWWPNHSSTFKPEKLLTFSKKKKMNNGIEYKVPHWCSSRKEHVREGGGPFLGSRRVGGGAGEAFPSLCPAAPSQHDELSNRNWYRP